MKVSQKGSLLSQHKILKNIVFLSVLVVIFGGKIALAQNTLPPVKNDYIPCDVQPCVTIAGSEWSEKNQNGVAVAVRMHQRAKI